jgi:hypothetical protein
MLKMTDREVNEIIAKAIRSLRVGKWDTYEIKDTLKHVDLQR